MDIRKLPLVVEELVCSLRVCSNMLRAHFVQDCHVPLLLIVPWICLCCVWYLRLFSCYFTGLSCCRYDRFTLSRSSSKKKSMYVWFTFLLGFCRSVFSWTQGSMFIFCFARASSLLSLLAPRPCPAGVGAHVVFPLEHAKVRNLRTGCKGANAKFCMQSNVCQRPPP